MDPASPLGRTVPRRLAEGVGIGYRYCIHDEILRCAPFFDFLEIPSGDYVDATRRARFDPHEANLRAACARFPVVSHGTGLSMGTSGAPDPAHLHALADFSARVPIGEYSEHLSFIQGVDHEVDAFMALPFTDLGVAVAVENVKRARKAVGVPFLVENVSYYFALPEATYTEAEFVSRVATGADCGILLDVANLWINSVNHRYDAEAFLRALPADRIAQAHFCGATRGPDSFLYDTHFEVTLPPVWRLIELALRHTSLRALVFERDQRFMPFQEVMEELFDARRLFRRFRDKPGAPREVNYAPDDSPGDDSVYSAELRRVQDVVCRMLLEPELGRAVEREGEAALIHTGIDRDSRRILAAIPAPARERIGRRLRETIARTARGAVESLP